MDEISETRLKAYIMVGAVGVAVILVADFISMSIRKSIEGIKLIGTTR